MIVKNEEIKEVCSKLLLALSSDNLSQITETLEMKVEDNSLVMVVTNREYVVKTKLNISTDEEFHATVSADTFLKLMGKVNSTNIEFKIVDNILNITADGHYKLPMIYKGDDLLVIPDIGIENITDTFTVTKEQLSSINNYNSKELAKVSAVVSPVQKMYYLDNKGCITFTTGACVNNFKIDTNTKFLLNSNIVKLFKLFKESEVDVSFGIDDEAGVKQNKIKFETDSVQLTSKILTEENLINSVPVESIRNMATNDYDFSAVINKQKLIDSLSRLMLFSDANLYIRPYGIFNFSSTKVTVTDKDSTNVEEITLENSLNITDKEESVIVDMNDLKVVLDGIKDEFITFNFGDHRAIVIQRPGVYNIIPECEL